ncbi:carcinine hydrolase/isopenicillin-N N-acyltransferase family protein [Candidatus Bipolaricaulota bacterium]
MARLIFRHILLPTMLAMAAMAPISAAEFIDPSVPQSCTVFLITDGERALGGGNEDQGAFPARAWFIPASDGKHGRLYLGFEGVVESGMNDQGLFYDSLSVPDLDVAAEEGKEIHGGMWTLRALETCSTVEEVVDFLDGISIPGTWTDQLFFGDRNGHSIIVEGKQVLRSARSYQICTNFSQSRTRPSDITCDRYLTGKEMLNAMESVTATAVRDVFAATADTYHDGSGTAYTAIYDPIGLTATLCFWRDFEHPIRFYLQEELARGPHVIELCDIAHPNPRREAWVANAQAELDRQVEARIDRTVDPVSTRGDLIGHYTVDPAIGLVPSPPVMIEALSIVWDGELPLLVAVPEGIFFDLRPAGNDVWFHTNVTMKPEMDVALRRDDAGRVIGATLTIIGLGEIPFIKVSDTPAYEPLPSTTLPAIRTEPESASESRGAAARRWAIGAELLLAVALALLLLLD